MGRIHKVDFSNIAATIENRHEGTRAARPLVQSIDVKPQDAAPGCMAQYAPQVMRLFERLAIFIEDYRARTDHVV